MTQLSHNFEGGTDGVTIAAGAASNSDTAGNNFFDSVNVDVTGTPGIVAYSNTHVHSGTMAAKFATGSVAAITDCDWNASRGTLTDDFCRFYFYPTTAFAINNEIIKWFSGALGNMGGIAFNAAQTVSAWNVSDTPIGTSSNTLAFNTWHRIEAHHFASTTVAQITIRLFIGANVEGVTPDETITSSTFTTSAASTARFDFGLPNASTTDVGKLVYFDDVVDAAADWVGPLSAPAGNQIIQVRSGLRLA